MKAFTDLYLELDKTTRTAEKVAALVRYFRTTPPLDAAWAVFLLSGRRIGKAVSSPLLRQWAAEASGNPLWLVEHSYSIVGDLAETLALILPAPAQTSAAPLHEIIERRLKGLSTAPGDQQREIVLSTWSELNTDQRLVFHKLLGGNFRVGVSRLLLIRALAEVAGVGPAVIANRMAGQWVPSAQAMLRLLSPHDPDAATDPGVPYPFMLAHPLNDGLDSLGPITDWLLEWKWDGIRAQLLRRAGRTWLWSRGDEMVAGAFPEIAMVGSSLAEETVLDGEIVAWDEDTGRPLPFTRLQRRLNRKTVELSFWPETPVTFIAFDVLETHGLDIRGRALFERREVLATLFRSLSPAPVLRQSEPVRCESWIDTRRVIQESRHRGVEGLMLKRGSSAYQPGRPTGSWWKLKVQPYTMDAVLIAAEPGHGRRAGLLTDYTFGVWEDHALVPIAKAYSGLTDAEIAEVDRFARQHTIARHGPVHAVEPLRVFEIGFEAIQLSSRHKAGLAVRFPRILRMRPDKRPAEADTLQSMRDLLKRVETPR